MKTETILSFLFILGVTPLLWGQTSLPTPGSAQVMAMGGVGVAYEGAHSLWRNQAGLADLTTPTLIAAGEQRFLLADIRSVSAGVAYPTASGAFGLTVNYFGFDAFNQQQIGLAYGRRLLDQLSIGARFLYLNTRIPDYGQRGHLTFELGVMAELLPELQIGAQIHNPLQLQVVENETLPTIFTLGVAWRASEKVLISGEMEKDIDFPARAKLGVDYRIVEELALRVGVGSNPSLISFGAGYLLENGLAFDLAVHYHQFLGFTPGVDIIYQWAE